MCFTQSKKGFFCCAVIFKTCTLIGHSNNSIPVYSKNHGINKRTNDKRKKPLIMLWQNMLLAENAPTDICSRLSIKNDLGDHISYYIIVISMITVNFSQSLREILASGFKSNVKQARKLSKSIGIIHKSSFFLSRLILFELCTIQ